MKVFLLYPDRDFDFDGVLPRNRADLVADLEIDTLLNAMAGGDAFVREVSGKVLLAGLDGPEPIGYRQRVLADCIDRPDVVRAMYDLAGAALRDKRGVWGFLSSQNPASVLSAAVGQLEVLLVRLRQLRRIAEADGGAFRSDAFTAFFRTVLTELGDDYLEEVTGHLKQLRFPGGQLISADLSQDNSGINYVLRSGTARRGWKERVGIAPRTVYAFTLPPRDEAGMQSLDAITGRGINAVANAAAQAADHVSSFFTMLRAELAFYVGCLNLHDRLSAREVPVCFPEPAGPDGVTFACADLRDASLALRVTPVVGNDADTAGRPLVVITGANSGGKSTFLRSVGLAQLMTQCGMFVTARSFRSSLCRGIFTHFIREEDPDLVSGRLDSELARMSDIADLIGRGDVILFNESFAATNEREGSEIGRQIVTALLEAGVRVFFVTHNFDLASGLGRQRPDAALFLRAPRQPNGRREYKLAPAPPLPTSFGADIYDRIGGWQGEAGARPRPA